MSSSSCESEPQPPVKIILVTGGVISGVGKGIVSSSLGVLLKGNGYRVTAIKIDPYINLDAGTFSPWEHGEVFVLDDGGEVDLDLGNYERFLNVCLTSDNNITTGKIFHQVMKDERAGKYLGKTVQFVPHITDAIKQWVEDVAQRPVDNSNIRPDVCIVELGGTVGDMESAAFLRAMSELAGPDNDNFMHVHVSLLIEMESTGELKTKPVQHSVQTVMKEGLFPDLLVCRSHQGTLNLNSKEKLARACNIRINQVVNVHDVSNIYRVPLLLMEQNVLEIIEKKLHLNRVEQSQALQNCPNFSQWTQLADLVDKYEDIVKIAFVGKYFHLDHNTGGSKTKIFTDAYSSVIKALRHAATHSERKLELLFVVSEHLEDGASEEQRKAAEQLLADADGILVPGGFGLRGIEGKIRACEYARTHKKPFLGICLGMQCAAIEFARNVCGIEGASSTEFWEEQQHQNEAAKEANSTPLTPEQKIVIEMLEHSGGDLGGTMRLGRRATVFLTTDSILYQLYGNNDAIEERHRHRYEVNPAIVPKLTQAGLRFVGMGVDGRKDNDNFANTSDNIRSLLQIACRRNELGEKSFNEKVKKLCDRGAETDTAVRMEMVELQNHPYFVGVQYHPEYTSHPLAPSPPFLGLILAASGQLQSYLDGSRVPSPVHLFKDVESTSHSNFHFLPSAGNSSASLRAYLSENLKNHHSNDLKVPKPSYPQQQADTEIENLTPPVFTVSDCGKRRPTLNELEVLNPSKRAQHENVVE